MNIDLPANITASDIAKHLRETRKNCFKEREYNEKHCFDLAVVSVIQAIKEKNPDFDYRAFGAMVGMTFAPNLG